MEPAVKLGGSPDNSEQLSNETPVYLQVCWQTFEAGLSQVQFVAG